MPDRTASLHHMIIPVADRDAAVRYFVELLELREPWENGFFQSVQLDDHVVLNFAAPPVEIQPQHYAFLVPDDVFDRIRARFDADGTPYTADPPGHRPGEVGAVNPDGGGRRLYFRGPSCHMLEVLTTRYNAVPAASRAVDGPGAPRTESADGMPVTRVADGTAPITPAMVRRAQDED